jgi:hypothetical protein
VDSVLCVVGGLRAGRWRSIKCVVEWFHFNRQLLPFDFQSLARPVLLREWQWKWDLDDTGRFAHSILPKVSLRP